MGRFFYFYFTYVPLWFKYLKQLIKPHRNIGHIGKNSSLQMNELPIPNSKFQITNSFLFLCNSAISALNILVLFLQTHVTLIIFSAAACQ